MPTGQEISAPEGLTPAEQLEYWRGLAHELYGALKLLADETKLSGNWTAKDYSWPKAITATKAAIEKAEGRS